VILGRRDADRVQGIRLNNRASLGHAATLLANRDCGRAVVCSRPYGRAGV